MELTSNYTPHTTTLHDSEEFLVCKETAYKISGRKKARCENTDFILLVGGLGAPRRKIREFRSF